MGTIHSDSCFENSSPEEFYAQATIQRHSIEDATLAVRVFGQGPNLVLIHGYPVHGYTWRKLLPTLAARFTCYVIDLPGLGDSAWTDGTSFTFSAQAHRVALLCKSLKLHSYTLIAQDTGATVARQLALLQPKQVAKLVIINSEIPGHRPPWITFYQLATKLPLAGALLGLLLRSDRFVRSPMALGQFYSDSRLFSNPKNVTPYIEPVISCSHRLSGMMAYLRDIEWDMVDSLRDRHGDIEADTLLIWGENDKTFPVELAEAMCAQFSAPCSLVRISGASLMPQEERPAEVLKVLIPFLA